MKKIADNITELSSGNTLTEWSLAVNSLNLKQEFVNATGISKGGASGYLAGFGFGTMSASAWIDRLKEL